MAIRERFRGIKTAFTTFPTAREWRWCGAVATAFIAATLGLGFATGFIHLTAPVFSGTKLFLFGAVILLRPCLLEELVYRALLVPHRDEQGTSKSTFIQSAVALVIFIAAHPLNGRFFRPQAYDAFGHPVFLLSAGMLGLVCTLTYRKTGSIYPAVIIHWLTVFAWIPFLSGKTWLD
jgi:uncharacterized protein